MKTYKHIYEQAVKEENIRADIETAAKHKHKRRDVQDVLKNVDPHIDIVKDMLLHHSYTTPPYEGFTIKDGAKDKQRTISKPRFCYDQIIANVIVHHVKPIVMKSMYHHVYGSIEGRGQIQVKKALEKWIRNDYMGSKYIAQGDVRDCYHSINQDRLSRLLHEKIKDEDFMEEADKFVYQMPVGIQDPDIIYHDNGGIVLGDPTSVWYSHLYFEKMDHYVSSLPGVDHYLRLADDFVLMGSNKKKLHAAMEETKRYLFEDMFLRLKFNYKVFRMDWIDKDGEHHGQFLDIDGYRFYRDKTTMRKGIMIHATRKASRVAKRDYPNIHDARQMMSHLARLKTCDCYNVYENYVKGKVNPKQLRGIISNYDRKERLNELERSRGLSDREACGD